MDKEPEAALIALRSNGSSAPDGKSGAAPGAEAVMTAGPTTAGYWPHWCVIGDLRVNPLAPLSVVVRGRNTVDPGPVRLLPITVTCPSYC